MMILRMEMLKKDQISIQSGPGRVELEHGEHHVFVMRMIPNPGNLQLDVVHVVLMTVNLYFIWVDWTIPRV